METQLKEVAVDLPEELDEGSLLDVVDAAIDDAYAALPIGSDQMNQNYRDR